MAFNCQGDDDLLNILVEQFFTGQLRDFDALDQPQMPAEALPHKGHTQSCATPACPAGVPPPPPCSAEAVPRQLSVDGYKHDRMEELGSSSISAAKDMLAARRRSPTPDFMSWMPFLGPSPPPQAWPTEMQPEQNAGGSGGLLQRNSGSSGGHVRSLV